MQTITKLIVLTVLCLSASIINAQDTIQKPNNQEKIERLKSYREHIHNEERNALKEVIESINKRLSNKEITFEKAEILKKEAAKKHALNIENRLAIVDNQIALYQRNEYANTTDKENRFGVMISNKTYSIKGNKTTPKYDILTSNDLLFAFGLNNALIEGQNLDDSPYKVGGSGFIELGWNWKTRVFKEAPFFRLKYGFSFQWNKLHLEDNKYLVQNENETTIETFPIPLRKSKFRVTNLVLPVHFEFGPLKKLEKENRVRYINNNKFKIGLGGYAGIRLSTLHKLKYEEAGKKMKDKLKQSYNTNKFVYGISTYIGFGDTAFYVKYDLSPIFKNQIINQNNISVGLRFDMD